MQVNDAFYDAAHASKLGKIVNYVTVSQFFQVWFLYPSCSIAGEYANHVVLVRKQVSCMACISWNYAAVFWTYMHKVSCKNGHYVFNYLAAYLKLLTAAGPLQAQSWHYCFRVTATSWKFSHPEHQDLVNYSLFSRAAMCTSTAMEGGCLSISNLQYKSSSIVQTR